MREGDVLLFSRATTWANFRSDPMGTFFTALIHFTTRSRYNHAALDIGDGLMVEAVSGGVKVNPARSSDQITVVDAVCIRDDELDCGGFYMGNDLEETLAWATGRVGWKYGSLNAFWCGFRNVFPGAAHIKHGGTIICSELVAEALARAGHDFDKDYALVSPGDLAEHFGLPR